MLVFSIVYRCVIPQITGNAILAYTMPWGMFDAFSVGGILAIRTKEKTVVEDRTYICYCCCFTVYNLCGFYDEGQTMSGGRAITMFSTSNNYGESLLRCKSLP